MYKKVLFTQFAIPSYDTLEYRSNVHLAAGYLVGYVKDKFPNTEFVITPRIYTDVLNENAYIDYVIDQKPDLLVFSLYLWNIEKSLRLVKRIKTMLPEAEFLFGGPEVNPDNEYLLNSDEFSQGVVGEGEIAFDKFLSTNGKTKTPGLLTKDYFNKCAKPRTTFTNETNPYLQNFIEIKPDSTLFFETVRGCPFTCNFCYYNKVYDKIIQVGHDQLEDIFKYAKENNMDELFLLDPSFNMQPKFDSLLDKLIELNRDYQFKISTELRADYLTDEQITKLKELNVVEVEIGLQTTNPQALELMGRANRIKETIERTKKMIDSGIDCKVDLIIGLPGDTLDGFKKSVDDVIKEGLELSIQIFRLSLLSGTEFFKRRKELGLVAQPTAPYYLENSPSFSESEIREAIEYAEETLDKTLYPVPQALLSKDFSKINEKYIVHFESNLKAIHKIIIESNEFKIDIIENDSRKLCESLCIHYIIGGSQKQHQSILESINCLFSIYPNNNFQFVLEFEKNLDRYFLYEFSQSIFKRDDSYLDRDSNANLGVALKLSASIAVVASEEYANSEEYETLKEQFELYLRIEDFDKTKIDKLYEDSKLYFVGESQKEAFEYLEIQGKLDEYTIFDSYSYEQRKVGSSQRIYKANLIEI